LVAIDLPGGPDFVEVLKQVWGRGDAILPVDQRLSPRAKRAVLLSLAPSWIVGPDLCWTRLEGGRDLEEGDAAVVATSGTTGVPKGVVLTMSALEASARASSARLGVVPGEHRWVACLPLSHVGGLSVVTRSLICGNELSVLASFDAQAVERLGGPQVLVSLVPTALQRVDPARFRTILLGGSVPPEDLPANVVTTYGMTETGSGVVYDGVPLADVEVRIEPGTGEIHLRCPMLLRCYRDGSCPLDAEGWYATGDCGAFDDQGRLVVAGRASDMIITGGENVWPAPVEAALATHPKVAEVAVAGRPDPEWGERVVAYVVPADPHSPPSLNELRALVADQVAPWAAPKELVTVANLPRTSIGKVRRDLLGA